MDRLILFRHGKTENRAPSGEDFDRRLLDRGRDDAALVAEALKSEGFAPDRALVSAAVRARQTWEAIAPIFTGVTVENRPDLYDSDARTLLSAGQTPLGKAVVIVAHNPGLQILSIALAQRAGDRAVEARLREGFATGAAAVFDFGPDTVAARGLFYPVDFGGGPE